MISELTEITEPPEAASFRGWIFYDDSCGFCRNLALWFENFFAARGFHFEPLQREWVQQRLNLTEEQALEEMRVLTSTGEVFGGADAVILLARQVWWAAPLAWLARFASGHAILHRFYRWVAAHRTCAINGTAAPSFSSRTRWCALAILPLIALATKPFLPAWGFMWLMAFALFLGCKWLTLGTALAARRRRLSLPSACLSPGVARNGGNPFPLSRTGTALLAVRGCCETRLWPSFGFCLAHSCFSASLDMPSSHCSPAGSEWWEWCWCSISVSSIS